MVTRITQMRHTDLNPAPTNDNGTSQNNAGCSWRLNDTCLVFVQTLDRHRDVLYHRGRVGLNHVALWAGSRDQVNALTEQVRARGLQVLYEDRHPFAGGPDRYALYFEDPDRIKVQLVAPEVGGDVAVRLETVALGVADA